MVQALQRAGSRRKAGARKSTSTKPREWLENTREQWADHANEALERAGRAERITRSESGERSTSKQRKTETNARWRGCRTVSRGCISGRTT